MMLYNLTTFGLEIKKIRIHMNLRQSDVKKLVGINEDTLRRLESGLSYPTLQTLDLLSMVYKHDIHDTYKYFCETPMRYIERISKEIMPLIRTMNYKKIQAIADGFKETFAATSIKNVKYISHKVNQFHEYLLSIHNIENSLKDKSRNDLSRLMTAMDLELNDLLKRDQAIRLDKLEIRIFILISVLYRYKDEFNHSEAVLKIALRELEHNYHKESDFLNIYILIVSNLMTVYHRIDLNDKIYDLYKDSLKVIEKYVGIKNIAAYLLRIGVSNYHIKNRDYNEFVRVALSILETSDYQEVASRYENNFKKLYDFLEI